MFAEGNVPFKSLDYGYQRNSSCMHTTVHVIVMMCMQHRSPMLQASRFHNSATVTAPLQHLCRGKPSAASFFSPLT